MFIKCMVFGLFQWCNFLHLSSVSVKSIEFFHTLKLLSYKKTVVTFLVMVGSVWNLLSFLLRGRGLLVCRVELI